MVVLLDPTEDPDDILRANRSRERRYMFDRAFDQTCDQVCMTYRLTEIVSDIVLFFVLFFVLLLRTKILFYSCTLGGSVSGDDSIPYRPGDDWL